MVEMLTKLRDPGGPLRRSRLGTPVGFYLGFEITSNFENYPYGFGKQIAPFA